MRLFAALFSVLAEARLSRFLRRSVLVAVFALAECLRGDAAFRRHDGQPNRHPSRCLRRGGRRREANGRKSVAERDDANRRFRRFTFLSLAPDTYTLSGELQGYDTVSISGIVIFADQSQRLTLKRRGACRRSAK